MNTVLYVALGKGYAAEANLSIQSLRGSIANRNLTVCVATDCPKQIQGPVEFLDWEPLRTASGSSVKINLLRRPKVLFLDTDTHVVGSLAPVFQLLDRFDFCAAHAPIRFTVDSGIPSSFPEFNSGVFAYRGTCPKVDRFFQAWRSKFRHLGLSPDQPSMRASLYDSDLRIATLPPEYNVRTITGGYLWGNPVIVHGRPVEQLARFAESLGSGNRPRLFQQLVV